MSWKAHQKGDDRTKRPRKLVRQLSTRAKDVLISDVNHGHIAMLTHMIYRSKVVPGESPKSTVRDAGAHRRSFDVRKRWHHTIQVASLKDKISKQKAIEKANAAKVNRDAYWIAQNAHGAVSVRAKQSSPAPRCLMMDPDHKLVRLWGSFIMAILLWIAFFLPLDLCFDVSQNEYTYDVGAKERWQTWTMIIDVAFWLDLFANFCTGYKTKCGRIEFNRRQVFWHYIQGGFCIDFVACIASLLSGNAEKFSSITRLARVPRFMRLIRMVRLVRLVRLSHLQWWHTGPPNTHSTGKRVISGGMSRMLQTGFWLVLVTHWTACVWYMLPAWSWSADPTLRVEQCESVEDPAMGPVSGMPHTSWVQQAGMCSADAPTIFTVSVYWAFSTLTTVGYGDINAASTREYVFSVLVMALGVVFYTVIVGNVVTVMGSFDKRSKERNAKRTLLQNFCSDQALPSDLRMKLFDHFEYSFSLNEKRSSDAQVLIDGMSVPLRVSTVLHIHRDTIAALSKYFDDKSDAFTAAVVEKLRPRIAYPDDEIVSIGAESDAMYFIKSGRAKVLGCRPPFDTLTTCLRSGDYFGEIGCILSEPRSRTVVAESICELLSISRKDLLCILSDFPDWLADIRDEAVKRISKNNENGDMSTSVIADPGPRKSSFGGIPMGEPATPPAGLANSPVDAVLVEQKGPAAYTQNMQVQQIPTGFMESFGQMQKQQAELIALVSALHTQMPIRAASTKPRSPRSNTAPLTAVENIV